MNIQIYGFPVGIHVLISVIFVLCSFIAFYFASRLYKRVGRRCRKKGCGSLHVKRVNKIHLGPKETISLRIGKKWRWWIRRVYTNTFSECLDCKHIELVKTSEDPISVIHAWKDWMINREQFIEDSKYNNIAYQANRDRLTGKHLIASENSILTDTPPIKIGRSALLLKFFNLWRGRRLKSQEEL